MSVCRYFIFSVISLLFSTGSMSEESRFDFVSIEYLVEQEIGRQVLPQIYQKLGIKITISPKPGKRAQAYAISGKKDGEIMRIWSYGLENPSTVRVPTPYYQLETMAFVKSNSGLLIKSKEDLRGLKVLKVRGVKHTNNITQSLDNVADVENTEKMMKFLQLGRGDVALTNTIDGLMAIKKLGYSNIVPMTEPMATLDLYHYLHRKHEEIVTKVDSAIKGMKLSGELDDIIRKAELQVIGK